MIATSDGAIACPMFRVEPSHVAKCDTITHLGQGALESIPGEKLVNDVLVGFLSLFLQIEACLVDQLVGACLAACTMASRSSNCSLFSRQLLTSG